MTVPLDPLTNLPGRAALEAVLKQSIEGSRPIGLAVLDIDHFLEVNEGFGHETGDRLLREIASLMTEVIPGSVYRTGGDEFAIALPGLSLEQAFLKMEGLRARVEAATERFGLPAGQPITISIGVAQYPRDAKTPRALGQAADIALGTVKEGQRNGVGLPLNEEMVMKSCYYPATSLRRLRTLGERLGRNDSSLLREALEDLFRKFDARAEH